MKDRIHRWRQARYEKKATKGKRPWGRTDTAAAEAEVIPAPNTGGLDVVRSPIKGTLSAKIIRADGTVEDLGVIARPEGYVVE